MNYEANYKTWEKIDGKVSYSEIKKYPHEIIADGFDEAEQIVKKNIEGNVIVTWLSGDEF